MLNIKKVAGVVLATLIIASPLAAFAQSGITTITPTGGGAPISTLGEARDSLASIVNWVIVVFWIITVLFLIWAAIIYLTAGGEEEKLKEAKSRVIYAVIAAAIALLANGITAIVTSLLQGGA